MALYGMHIGPRHETFLYFLHPPVVNDHPLKVKKRIGHVFYMTIPSHTTESVDMLARIGREPQNDMSFQ